MPITTLEDGPDRVLFGEGAAEAAPAELGRLGASRVLVIGSGRRPEGPARVARALGSLAVGTFPVDAPQVPVATARAAVAAAEEARADWVLAVGGGTPIGVTKAIALELPVRLAAIPTTYAGSERTDIWGLVDGGRKTTGRDPRVRPRLVLYDPALTRELPRELSLQSLFNALAHAAEALYAAEASPEAVRAARAALRPLLDGLRALAADPADRLGRERALLGAYFAATALGGAAMGLHHKLAHVLGGAFDAPHGPTHAVMLPYSLGFVLPAAPAATEALREAFGHPDPPAFLYDLQRTFGLPTSARSLGLREYQLPAIADEVLRHPYRSPRTPDRGALLGLLTDALHDRRPSLVSRREPLPGGVSGPHAGLEITVRGAPLERARVVVLGLHGRGASADRLLGDLERRLGPATDVTWVAPQARDNTWYPKGFLAPPADNQPHLDSALAVVEALWERLAAAVGPERVIPVGFSQGACLLATWLSVTTARPRRLLLFSGAPTPLPEATFAAAAGAAIHLGGSAADPWLPAGLLEASADRLRAAGAEVALSLVPGEVHAIHPPDDAALRAAVAAVPR